MMWYTCWKHLPLTSFYRVQQIALLKHARTKASGCRCWAVSIGQSESSSPQSILECEERALPILTHPSDVLVKVHAASVNPIDVRMAGGYGSSVVHAMKRWVEFTNSPTSLCSPLASDTRAVLGRDFSGVVSAVGGSVSRFKVGDEVFGALAANRSGTHAEYIVASSENIALKPSDLSHIEASSLPYVALTFASAIHIFSCVTPKHLLHKRVFLNGGAGGIGTFAVQYLKAHGCEVTVAMSADAMDMGRQLGADHVLDYKNPSFKEQLHQLAGFDIGFDCVGDETALAYIQPGGVFVTVTSPLLKKTDEFGVSAGTAVSALDFTNKALNAWISHGVHYRWAFFTPSGQLLRSIVPLMEQKQIKPVIEKIFPFEETPAAYEKVSHSKGRGKTVIQILSES